MATKKKPKSTDSAILHTLWVDGVNSGGKGGGNFMADRSKEDNKALLKLFRALLKSQTQALEAVKGIVAIRKLEGDVSEDPSKLASCDLSVEKLTAEVAALQAEIDEATGVTPAEPAPAPAPAKKAPAAKKVAAKKVAAKKTKR